MKDSKENELNKSLIQYVNFIRNAFSNMGGFPDELNNLTIFNRSELTEEEKPIFNTAYQKVKSKTFMKNCFLNSLQLSMADKTGSIKLVEGYAFKYIPMEHSWNTINGKLIDITFNISDNKTPYLGEFPEDTAYYGYVFDGLNLKDWYKFANKANDFSLLGISGRKFLGKY